MPIADTSMNDGRIVCTAKPRSTPVAIADHSRRRGVRHGRSSSVSIHATASSVARMLRL